MSPLRTIAIAAAVALAGLTGAANAKPLIVNPNLNLKVKIKLCIPHYETRRIHLWKTNYDLVIVYYVNRFCQKKIVRIHRVFHLHRHLLARAS